MVRDVRADPDDPYRVTVDMEVVQPLDNIDLHLVVGDEQGGDEHAGN